jgi:primosomal protein N' (replication factor Y)
MYILTVIPIDKGIKKEYLTYFSAQEVNLGTIVVVPVRSREIDALVVGIEEALNLKQEIKDAKFQLKKIIKAYGRAPFGDAFFETCTRMQQYTLYKTGVIVDTLLPSIFLDKKILDINKNRKNAKPLEKERVMAPEKLIFQASVQDRMGWYKTLIRESFSKKESIFICVPTKYDTEKFRENLSRGIEKYVYTFSRDVNKKNLIINYKKCLDEEHPILIIGTGSFLALPRNDIRTIIIENESSDSYKQFIRPFIDIRTFVEVFASTSNTKLIFGDTMLRPETLYRHTNKELGEVASPIFRFSGNQKQKLIDMKGEVNHKNDKTFAILSRETIGLIDECIKNKESILLFTVRKGLAGVTTCNDCGHTILCQNCTSPLVLYGKKNNKEIVERIFMCNKCGHKHKTEIRCPICTSWNLNPLGVGTDRVYAEVKRLFPDANIIQIDKETTQTDSEAKIAIEKFQNTPGSILIGTEMVFSYINQELDHSVIISIDGLFSIPSFNINQKVLHIIEKMQSITKDKTIIQTRSIDNPILKNIISGNVLPIYREDLVERRTFGYPPFKKLIKITFSGTQKEGEVAHKYINKVLEPYEPQIFSAFTSKVKGEYITNTVIKINPDLWPIPLKNDTKRDEDLGKRLYALSNAFNLNIDPEDLL